MSGYDGRTKGKRIRKLQSGSSNAQARWKYLGADVSDVLASSASPALVKQRALPRSLSSSAALSTRDEHHPQRRASTRASLDRGGYDINGDGVVDARERRMAKFLDTMIARREREPGAPPDSELSDAELLGMRQRAGRLLIAKEFIERNQGHLWRYGAIFTGKDDDQSTEYIAAHKNFKKLVAYLENVERQRSIRSSQQFRGCIRSTSDQQEGDEQERQTWVETSRKLRDTLFSKFPLPELQPKKVVSQFYTEEEDPHFRPRASKVAINTYGAIDIDGDGVIDDDEMKLHLRLQEAADSSGEGSSRHQQQLEGRRMMARDFVMRNEGRLRLFDASYKDKSPDQVADEIAASKAFAKDFNRLRAKERVLRLKSSAGVSGCLAQLEALELAEDPTRALEFRRVRDRTELLRARRELQKPLALQRGILKGDGDGVVQDGGDPRKTFAVRTEARMGRVASESSVGLPRIFDAPRRIEPTGSFSVTKWLLDDERNNFRDSWL